MAVVTPVEPVQAPVPQTMVPPASRLPDVLPTERLNDRAKPTRELRDRLRRIPNARNAVAVVATVLQSYGVVVAGAYINTWWSYLAAFILMTRGHVCLNILGHEAAHRLLFSNRRANDVVGRFLAYSSYQAMLAYRRAHFAHHRDEMGPDEPDASLYAGYPIPRDSWRRKLTRDVVGISAYKNFRVLFGAIRKRRSEAIQIAALHVVLLGASIVFMRPLAYVVWILSWSTLWRVSNRLRAIAGVREASHDVVVRLDPLRRAVFDRYAWREQDDWILCWDHARYVNHSCDANCLGLGVDYEIALRDIEAGEQLTDDYRSLGEFEDPFECLCGSVQCTGWVTPGPDTDLRRRWRDHIEGAWRLVGAVPQPLQLYLPLPAPAASAVAL